MSLTVDDLTKIEILVDYKITEKLVEADYVTNARFNEAITELKEMFISVRKDLDVDRVIMMEEIRLSKKQRERNEILVKETKEEIMSSKKQREGNEILIQENKEVMERNELAFEKNKEVIERSEILMEKNMREIVANRKERKLLKKKLAIL